MEEPRWQGALGVALAAALLHPFAAAGLAFPDIDFLLQGTLGHRSMLTHSVLVPLLALGLFLAVPAPATGTEAVAARGWRWAAGWFLLGLGLHLIADALPRGCRGGALAHWPRWPPGSGSRAMGCGASLLWFAANAAAAVALAEWLLRHEGRWLTRARHAASAVVLAVTMVAIEGKPLLLPLVLAAWAAVTVAARVALRRMAGGAFNGRAAHAPADRR